MTNAMREQIQDLALLVQAGYLTEEHANYILQQLQHPPMPQLRWARARQRRMTWGPKDITWAQKEHDL